MQGGGHPDEMLGAMMQPLTQGDLSLAGPPTDPQDHAARVQGWKSFLTAMQHDPYVQGLMMNFGAGLTQPAPTTAATIGQGLGAAGRYQADVSDAQRGAMALRYAQAQDKQKAGLERERLELAKQQEQRLAGTAEAELQLKARELAAKLAGLGYFSKTGKAPLTYNSAMNLAKDVIKHRAFFDFEKFPRDVPLEELLDATARELMRLSLGEEAAPPTQENQIHYDEDGRPYFLVPDTEAGVGSGGGF